MITLEQWSKLKFSGRYTVNTVRSWARNGNISPSPVKIGRDWWVDEGAVYVRTGKEISIPDNVDMRVKAVDPVVLAILNKAA